MEDDHLMLTKVGLKIVAAKKKSVHSEDVQKRCFDVLKLKILMLNITSDWSWAKFMKHSK